MLPWLNLFLGIALVVVAGALVVRSAGFFGFVSPTGIFYVLFVVFIFVGTVLIDQGITLSYATEVQTFPLFLGLTILSFALGTVAASVAFSFSPFEETREYASRDISGGHVLNMYGVVVPLLGALLVVIALVFVRFGTPLSPDVSYRSWAASVSLSMLVITLLLPFTTLLVLVVGTVREDERLRRVGLASLLVVLVFMLLTSRRYPVLDFGIWGLCLLAYVKFRSLGEQLRGATYSALAAVPFFVGVQLLRAPRTLSSGTLLDTSVRFVRNRIFLAEATAVNYIFTTFPQQRPFLGESTLLATLASVIPGISNNATFGEELFNAVNAGSGGFLPPTIIGNMYAISGQLSLVWLFVWGFVLQALLVVFVRSKKTPVTVVLFAVTSGLFGRSLITGVLTPITRSKYLVALLLLLVLVSSKLPRAGSTPRRTSE